MKAKIFCRINEKGHHSFYLSTSDDQYYLFQQDYRRGVNEYYKNGVSLDQAISFSHSHKDNAIIRTMEKIPMYIKYIEKEYAIAVLDKTAKKNNNYKRARAA